MRHFLSKECGLYKIRNILFPQLVKARGSSILLGMKIPAYSPEIETQMLNFYDSLSEKDRRRYAAIEASKLGYGGASYIRQVLRCDDRTITRGRQELKTELSGEGQRIRQLGAGRKSVLANMA